jgi:hypothetical protein
MDPMSRWILIVIFIALAIWRLVRYLRIALGTRPAQFDTAGSGFTARSEHASLGEVPTLQPPPKSSFVARQAEVLGAIAAWVAANALLWFLLLGLPLLKSVPPMLLGTAGIFANFYLIPWARNLGRRFRARLEGSRALG